MSRARHSPPYRLDFPFRGCMLLRHWRVFAACQRRAFNTVNSARPPRRTRLLYPTAAVLASGAAFTAYQSGGDAPFRHAYLATVRSARVAEAVVLDVVDYKWTLGKSYDSQEAKFTATSECHSRSAHRV